jgi:hypothetical protein
MDRATHHRRAPLNANFSELADLGVRQVEALVEAQSKLSQRFQEANAGWLQRFEVEAALASDLAANLGKSGSPAEVVSAWQDWASRRIDLVAADAAHLARDFGALASEGARVFAGGWSRVGDGSTQGSS